MESIIVPSSPDQSISPYNKNMKRNTRHFIQNGLLFTPPPSLSYSFPPPSFSLVNPNHHHQQQQHKKPPLLPLPITTKPYASLPSRIRGPSCSPTNKNFNRSIKKSKPSSISPKKEDSKKDFNSRITSSTAATKGVSECLIIASTNRLGPDPIDLPKTVSGVLSSSVGGAITCKVLADLDKFSGSVFTLSPPPSSLPLPKFSLRPKLSCSAEAGFDAGATDNLRRLLRLR